MPTKNQPSEFSEKVRNVVRSIPKGSVLSYQQVATLAGNKKATRAVASVMRKNFDETVPCHRVIKSNGEVGEYNRGGAAKKQALLHLEGWTGSLSDLPR